MNLNINPAAVAQAAQDLQAIAAAVEDASTAAVHPITVIIPPGAEEISAVTTALFNSLGAKFNALLGQALSFQSQFASLLGQSQSAYRTTEMAAQQALRDAVTSTERPFVPLIVQAEETLFGVGAPPVTAPPLPTVTNSTVALLIGGTSLPLLYPGSVDRVMNSYVLPRFPGATGVPFFTPEQAWPITPQLGGLTINQSVTAGVSLLNSGIMKELGQGNNVVTWGTSQGAWVLSDEIKSLMAQGSQGVGKISFILTGDPANPNGGPLERFVGGYIPGLGVTATGATPPNSPYQTAIYTNQYDGVADWPQYPLNVVSDANAVMGSLTGQHFYDWYPSQMGDYFQLPTSPGYSGNTTYWFRLDPTLPLVAPLRSIPYVGNAMADLLQPDLRVIVDMGYGTGEYANIPTPAQLFAIPNPANVIPDLINGTVQGPTAALVDLGVLPASEFPTTYPYAPLADPALNFPSGQPPVTAISLLTGFEGQLIEALLP